LKNKKLKLSISPSNTRAMDFYQKMDWVDLGPNQAHPEDNVMEKNI